MKKTVYLFSGEGTRSTKSDYKLAQLSPLWSEINTILQKNLNLTLENLWENHEELHRCPTSPVVTVAAQICLADLWQRWGYKADVVIGHSIGELAAAYQAGFYNLEEIILLTHQVGNAAASLEGIMLHGFVEEEEVETLPVRVSSRNFTVANKTHVTLSGSFDEMEAFHSDHKDFIKMRPHHPWHHSDYEDHVIDLGKAQTKPVGDVFFVSGVTARFESELRDSHWQDWLTRPIDFIRAMAVIGERYQSDEIEIIEIGFHPVLEQCCQIFNNYRYVSTMYREEDEFTWILHQRRRLSSHKFIESLVKHIKSFRADLDFNIPLAYQGFSSLTFVEFTALLEPYFPGLVPQDFYRYKSVQQLIDQFGSSAAVASAVTRQYKRNRVAISGMSCKFPESVETPEQYWHMLQAGEDQVKGAPVRGDYEAGFLGAIVSRFDHRYFNISEAEAKSMDPQQILALELTEMLWRDAGIDPNLLDRSRVGVYIGAWNQEYPGNRESVYYPTGSNPSIIASRISYHYDLRGPSWVANTACSSSLVAIHYACKDIEAGRVDYAIAGGVNILLGNEYTHSMRDSGFLSQDQRCKTFDDSANGYVRSEGGGLVLLVNRDLVETYYAEILGSSINQNGGRTQVITAPHPEAQEELINQACSDAEIVPTDIAYVECHGTGTKLGDPIEISALQNTVAKNRETTCYLGSVKSNIGHLESAAGIAGLIKSVLVLHQETIPGNIHFNTPNQFIDFSNYHLKVVDQQTPLSSTSYIGVSSFGFGGANAHVILTGAENEIRKQLVHHQVPFDRERALPIQEYYKINDQSDNQPEHPDKEENETIEIKVLITATFEELTGIADIVPDIALTDQGLDSLSATDFVSTLQKKLKIELDSDLLFDYPYVDSLVDYLDNNINKREDSKQSNELKSREDIAELVSTLFYELTNVSEIDPDIELTDQGLDSLSATELLTRVEQQVGVSIDTDLLFEYPLYDQLVDEVYRNLTVPA